ncbi:MAG: hypothetical protein DWQ31_11460 [Planctomycetota bacterium]|nr:MAG: hypothetical protein DWQ31_11460 [Planctomycetota bacterium]REJ97835.1 MAG: hypothetical protein DWQ35_01270 [Planctomycetota bacterium]REK22899.1 MAG: hypothetical protein DWQ42_16445 [Planctomycetota bacterium]REK37401.1 MAG: hypothetical protein DWQ46_22230 [Planctomycetota bacterium]
MIRETATVCERCVLTTSVPGVSLDEEGVCNVCREYEANRSTYDAYFKTEDDLAALFRRTHSPEAPYDVLLMYSGGKDSTYVLNRLVDMGQRILAVTFDNDYVPKGCFDNIRGVCEDAGVDSLILSLNRATMDRVFARSLEQDSQVCTGCFRALTARGTEVAIEKGIPIVMTGLSRGQIFDTKVHQLLAAGKTDIDEIDRWLRAFRRRYHEQKDEIAELINDRAAADLAAFERVHFIDFFRYCKVTKEDIVALIKERNPAWRKPENVGGCSSNCMINDVGIKVHQETKGYHNYAVPAAWDVRFGHETREEVLEELETDLDERRIHGILTQLKINYHVKDGAV